MIQQLEAASVGRPITRAGVSLFPTYLHQRGAQVGIAAPTSVRIAEQPDAAVPSLSVTNLTGSPVLLAEGDTVNGGRQNRIINVSVLVPANRTIDLPVSCVEAGRWGGGTEFTRSSMSATRRVRRATLLGVDDNLRRGDSSRRSNQSQVWDTVRYELDRLGTRNQSERFDEARNAIARDRARAMAIDELVGMGPLSGQMGLVISHGSRVVGFETFATPELLAAHWESLVTAALLDAPGHVRGTPSATQALRFVSRFATSPSAMEAGVGLGRQRHVRSNRLVGQALEWDDAIVHASCFALAG